MTPFDAAAEAAAAIRSRTDLKPDVLLVLGSGLSPMADAVEDAVSIPYSDIPNFEASTAPGHAGRIVLGTLAGRPVAVMAGRHHLYEGYEADQIVLPVRTARLLGAGTMIITNAAGGVNADFSQGLLMLMTDHINMTGGNPLVGPNDLRLGSRFPDMSDAYDPALRQLALQCAERLRMPLAQGVYLAFKGPSYETPAEIRMARTLGADAVGMSTVMETIAATHCGMRVLGISVITNMAAGMLPQKLTEEEVMETGRAVRQELTDLILAILDKLEV
jgi:purine-nucleoside phosphorylase